MVSVKDLVGRKLQQIGRAAAMCWVHLGDFVELTVRGKTQIVGEYALHLDCPWRIKKIDPVEIVLGSSDMFLPSTKHEDDVPFNWDIQGNNLFDEKVMCLFFPEKDIFVEKAELSISNDLTLQFSNGYCLECFVTGSTREECWRLFKPQLNDGDFVVTGQGAEII